MVSVETPKPSDIKAPEASATQAYQPRFEEIHNYLSQTDVKFIENIVDTYWKAYK